ncbi:MAG: FtsK/SpoIIIE domain-containing protein [Galbitalea sp.]
MTAIRPPRPPEVPAPHRFPVLATVAPIVASAVLFAVTRSAYTLVFASLGPVIAIATTADSALQRRRAIARERSRFFAGVARARESVDRAKAAELLELAERTPSAHGLTAPGSTRWRDAGDRPIALRVGNGRLPSGVDYDRTGADVADVTDAAVSSALRDLRDHATWLRDAPIRLDVTMGIAVLGPPRLVAACARGLALQLAAVLSPAVAVVRPPSLPGWEWLRELPHPAGEPTGTASVEFVSPTRTLRLSLGGDARPPREVTALAEAVIELDADGLARLTSAEGTATAPNGRFRPEFVDLETATVAAAALTARATGLGIRGAGSAALPAAVDLSSLAASGADDPAGLAAAVGRDEAGPLSIDLVADGPHAIVGGTTGSGKSELLVSWVLAMASERPPEAVSFLFVDFKGGASFGPLGGLPHCVGVITDLDAEQSRRALASLGAELRSRERALAARGLRSIDDAPDRAPFARLVIVVDEYAALVEQDTGLHAAFADIAARGRSLGVHLILCTQRPAGVVRDGILANCALRISLRVANPADSSAVIGSEAAARLPQRPPGRALASVAGGAPTLFQVARSSAADVAGVGERWQSAPRPGAPWCPPLPRRLGVAALRLGAPDGSLPFALADIPEQQRQEPARFRPTEHGSLLIVGAAGSGKSGVLAALSAVPSNTAVVRVPADLPHLWDAIERELQPGRTGPRLLLLDDLDAVVAACGDGYQPALLESLARLLRDGPAAGVHCAVAAQRVSGPLQGVAALCGSLLVLRMPNRQEHVLAGGEASEFLADLSPGAGTLARASNPGRRGRGPRAARRTAAGRSAATRLGRARRRLDASRTVRGGASCRRARSCRRAARAEPVRRRERTRSLPRRLAPDPDRRPGCLAVAVVALRVAAARGRHPLRRVFAGRVPGAHPVAGAAAALSARGTHALAASTRRRDQPGRDR